MLAKKIGDFKFKAAILAAGEGSRLKAQGMTTPKPLLSIGGMPLIERLIWQFRVVGASQIVLIINEEIPQVLDYLQTLELGVPISTLIKSTPSSFHSFCALRPFLEGEPFLLSMVDSFFSTNELEGFVRYARYRSDLDGLLALTGFIADENPLHVRLNDDKQVTAIGPGAQSSPYVTGGVYWFSSKIFKPVKQAQKMGINRMRNFLSFLLQQGYSLGGYQFDKIVDVDTIEDIEFAEQMERT